MQFVIYGWDGTDEQAPQRRQATRPAHLEGVKQLKAQGHLLFAGAMLDDQEQMRGSTMVVDFESREALQNWLDQEPYILQSVWQKIEIHPFRVANV